MEMQPQAQDFVWFGWQSAIAMLGLSDLKTLVKKAFDRGFIDSNVLEFDHFEQDLRRGIERLGEPCRLDDHEYSLFGDTIDELSEWYCFSERYDPCPCGSGKKFKRCCLAAVRLGLITPDVALTDQTRYSFIH